MKVLVRLILLLLAAALATPIAAQQAPSFGLDGTPLRKQETRLQATPQHAMAAGDTLELVIEGEAGEGNDVGWRLLASPAALATRGDLEDDVSLTVEEGSIEAFYTWDTYPDGTTTSATPLEPGRGFLLYLFDDEDDPIDPALTLDLPGPANTSDVTVAPLPRNAQLHLLGNPFMEAFELDALELPARGFQATVQIPNPATSSYVLRTTSDTLAAWQGFIAERSALGAGATSLTFPLDGRVDTVVALVGKRGAEPSAALAFDLIGRDAQDAVITHDEAIRLVFHEGAQAGWDVYEASKLPPLRPVPSVQLALLGSHGDAAVDLAQASFAPGGTRPVEVGAALRPFYVEDGASIDMELRWDVAVLAAWSATLIDEASGQEVDLLAEESYRFTFEPSEGAAPRFRLRVDRAGASSRDGEEPRGAASALEAVYPNPAGGAATIRYRLARPTPIHVSVIDVLGRTVEVLANGPEAGGSHELRWRPASLAPGTYFVRLQTEEGSFTQPVLVTR